MQKFTKLATGTVLALMVTTTGIPQALAQSKVTLKFWTFLAMKGTDPRSVALSGIVEGFNKSQSDYEVQVESIPFARFDGQVVQATAAGQGPDMLNVYTDNLAMHVDAGTLQPLGPYSSGLPSDFVTDPKFFKFDGKLMALPWDTRTWLLWYRKDLMDAKGLPVPTTLDELGKTAAAISTNDIMGFGIGSGSAANGIGVTETFIPILWGAGGEVFDKNGKAAFNSEAGVKTLSFLRDLVTKYKGMRQSVVSMGIEDLFTAYRAGTVGMTVMGSFRVAGGRNSEATGDKLQTAPVPGFTKDAPSTARLASQTLAIGAHSKHPEGAAKFINYYLNTDSQLTFAKANVLPSRQSTYDQPLLADNAELQAWKTYGVKYGRYQPTPPDFPKLSEEIAKALQRTVIDGTDPKAALDAAAAAYDAQHK